MRRRSSLCSSDKKSGMDRFADFFMNRYEDELIELLRRQDTEIYHSLMFNLNELLDCDLKLADYLMEEPDTALLWADNAVYHAQSTLYTKFNPNKGDKHHNNNHNSHDYDNESVHIMNERFSIKRKCKARLQGQLLYSIRNRPTVSSIRSCDVNQIIQIRGTVIRSSKVKLLESSKKYECLVCNIQFTVHADVLNEKDIEFPRMCRNTEKQCRSTKFSAIPDSLEAIDFQEIHLQEQIQKLGLGKIPRSIRCVLTCDLADVCQPGDDVEIVGIVRNHWSSFKAFNKGDSRWDISMYIEVVSLNRTDNININDNSLMSNDYKSIFDQFWCQYGYKNPIKARNMILANLCPQLCGMYVIKLAVALTIIGGLSREEYGTRIRGQSHLLLVGDPGTGKSQLLRYAARMSTRSVLTTGVGTTSAGLTVSAVKDGGAWVLEAGALVLADGGICCIDEFGSVSERDRGVIHEAMEQQTISVAKGGFVCSLNSRSTVLAAMNPPSGGFDPRADLSVNTSMASSLLSRFDVILLLLDQKNDRWDRQVGQHLMDNICEPEFPKIDFIYNHNHNNNGGGGDDITQSTAGAGADGTCTPGSNGNGSSTPCNFDEWPSTYQFEQDMQRFESQKEERVHWTIDQMQAYFSMIKQLQPEFSDAAEIILTKYYQKHRDNSKRDKSRTTIRLLESLIRLAQAHARLMYRDVVLPLDAVQAVYLMEKSLATTNSISDYSVLQTLFPDDPKQEYVKEREMIFAMLSFSNKHYTNIDALNDAPYDYQQKITEKDLKNMEQELNDPEIAQMFNEDIEFEFESTNNNNDNNMDNAGSPNSSLYANNDEYLNKNKNTNNNNVDECSQNSSVSKLKQRQNAKDTASPLQQNEFAKPTTSLTQKRNRRCNNSNNNPPSPLNPNQNVENVQNDEPPNFRRRNSRSNNLNQRKLSQQQQSQTADKNGECSNYPSQSRLIINSESNNNSVPETPEGHIKKRRNSNNFEEKSESQTESAQTHRTNISKKRSRIQSEMNLDDDDNTHINKRRKLNDKRNNIVTPAMSAETGSQMKGPPPTHSGQLLSDIILENNDDDDDMDFNFDFDTNDNETSNSNTNTGTTKKRKKKFF